jgi:hypothetical protein
MHLGFWYRLFVRFIGKSIFWIFEKAFRCKHSLIYLWATVKAVVTIVTPIIQANAMAEIEIFLGYLGCRQKRLLHRLEQSALCC